METMIKETSSALAYQYQDALYLNITPRCPTACAFCIKFSWDYQYRGYNLLLKKDPSVQQVLDAIDDPTRYSEIVFCGYGESTYRLEAMREISLALKKRGAKKIRLNTIGLGNLIQKRDIVPDLAKFLEVISISLNTMDPEEWVKIHRPLPEFKEKGFEGVLDFIRKCAQQIPQTWVTAVQRPGVCLEAFEGFVKQLGANVRFRPYLETYESK
jgi:TatD DNase family protein